MAIEKLTPASREEWLELRKQTIGASDIASLFGIHPWKSAFELFAEKTGRIGQDIESPAMKRGRYMESVALDLLREEKPDWIITPNPMPGGQFYRDLEMGLSATPDAFAKIGDTTAIVQVKSVQAMAFRQKWRNDDGEIEPPLYVAVQVLQEALLTGADMGIAVALVVDHGIDLHAIEVPLNEGVIDRIKDEAGDFWARVKEGRPFPPDYARDGAALAKIYANDDGSEIDLSGNNRVVELVAEREKLKARESDGNAAEKERKVIDAELIDLLGNASRGRLADGRIIEAKTTRRPERITAASSFRSVRIKEIRSAK